MEAYCKQNTVDGSAKEDPSAAEPPLRIEGDADRNNHRGGNDDFSQPRDRHNLMNDAENRRLFANTVATMAGVSSEITEHALANDAQVSPAYAEGVRPAMK